MRLIYITLAYFAAILILISSTEGNGTLCDEHPTEGKGMPCDEHPTTACRTSKYCPNTYICNKKIGKCCRDKFYPPGCETVVDPMTKAPFKCRGVESRRCDSFGNYICITDPSGRNRYSMCCKDCVCFDDSGNARRKHDGEWTQSDGCTKCTCEANNKPRCDSSLCGNQCGEYSEFSPCPKNTCGKQAKIRKCKNSKYGNLQFDNELSMAICYPNPPAQCPQPGVAITEKQQIIVGGGEVYPKFNYRWMVHFAKKEKICVNRKYLEEDRVHCGGSILSPFHILTAAHCLHFVDLSKITIKTGKHNLSEYETLEQSPTIKDIKFHESYSRESRYNNDIAIITLNKPLQFNDHTHPINLPPRMLDIKTFKKLKKGLCKVIGWGLTDATDSCSTSDLLLEVEINLEAKSTCSKKLHLQVTDNMLCATAKNPAKELSKRLDSCNSNSGGPLMCRKGVKWYQYGIVNWGPVDELGKPSCGETAGVYTKVPNYLDWINDVISTDGGWGEFSEYSACSVSCGGGIKSRVKVCTNPLPIGNGICPGFTDKTPAGDMVYIEDEECNLNPC